MIQKSVATLTCGSFNIGGDGIARLSAATKLPTDGQENCPLVAMRSAHSLPILSARLRGTGLLLRTRAGLRIFKKFPQMAVIERGRGLLHQYGVVCTGGIFCLEV